MKRLLAIFSLILLICVFTIYMTSPIYRSYQRMISDSFKDFKDIEFVSINDHNGGYAVYFDLNNDSISDTALDEAVRSFNIIINVLDKNPDHPMNGRDIYIIVMQKNHRSSSWINIEYKSNKVNIDINADSKKLSYDSINDIAFDIDSLKIQNASSFEIESVIGIKIKTKLELIDCMYSNKDYALNDNDISAIKNNNPDIKILVDDPVKHYREY